MDKKQLQWTYKELHKIGLEEILFPAQPDNGIGKEDDIASL